METITLTNTHAVLWSPDAFGGQTMTNYIQLEVLKLPKRSAKGKTGADVGWTAHKDAVITEDYRNA